VNILAGDGGLSPEYVGINKKLYWYLFWMWKCWFCKWEIRLWLYHWDTCLRF